MLDLIQPFLRDHDLEFGRCIPIPSSAPPVGTLLIIDDGSMRKDDRDAMLTRFRTTSMPVLLVSLKSGSVGLNLTSASRVIMLDLWWNPAIEEQAIDRVHRIGMAFPGTEKSISEKLKDDINQFLVCLSCVLFVLCFVRLVFYLSL